MTAESQIKYRPNGHPFKLAVMNCHYIKFPLSYFFDSVQRFGFDSIELFGAMPHFFLDDVDGTLIESVKRQVNEKKLNLVSFCPAQGAYPVNIAIDEAPVRRRSVEMLKKGIEAAGALGCRTMLVSPGFGYHNQHKEISWGYSVQSLAELAETAKENDVILTIEPLTPTTANLVNTSAEAAKMLREVNSPYVKSMMDIGVMSAMGESVADYFDNLGDNLEHIHFTDGPGAHVALGDGSFPMKKHLEDIRKEGYKGILSFEINDKRYLLNPDEALQRNIEWLKQNGLSD